MLPMTLKPAYDLRPLAIGEMLDYTFRIYQRIFRYIAIPTAILLGPMLFPMYLLTGALQQFGTLMERNPSLFDDVASWGAATSVILEHTGLDLTWTANFGLPELGLFAVATLLYTIFFMIATIMTHLMTIGIVGQRILGIDPSWEELGRIVTRFGWRGVGLTFLQLVVLLVPFVPSLVLSLLTAVGGPDFLSYIAVALVFPAYFVMIWLMFMVYLSEPALVVEDLGPVAAMKRAMQLIRGNWWRFFGVLLVMGLITTMLQSLTTGLSAWLLILLFPRYEMFISGTLNTVITVFLTPLNYIVIVLFYFDVRVRNEQFDLYFLLGQQTTGLATDGIDPALAMPPEDQPYVGYTIPPPPGRPTLPGQ